MKNYILVLLAVTVITILVTDYTTAYAESYTFELPEDYVDPAPHNVNGTDITNSAVQIDVVDVVYYGPDGSEILPPASKIRIEENEYQVNMTNSYAGVIMNKQSGSVSVVVGNDTLIASDSYIVRASVWGQDNWFNLFVNDEPMTITVEHPTEYTSIVSVIRENNEGLFEVEYNFTGRQVKSTAYFTNYLFQNHKIAFTQTLDTIDDIMIDDDKLKTKNNKNKEYKHDKLKKNDFKLKMGSLHYKSGVGFDQFWSARIADDGKIAIDYANINSTTPIGETAILDPITQVSCTYGPNGCDGNFGTYTTAGGLYPTSQVVIFSEISKSDVRVKLVEPANNNRGRNVIGMQVQGTGTYDYSKTIYISHSCSLSGCPDSVSTDYSHVNNGTEYFNRLYGNFAMTWCTSCIPNVQHYDYDITNEILVNVTAPENLTVNANTIGELDLAWTANDALEYEIERSVNDCSSWSTLVATTGNTLKTYTDTGLANGTSYCYRMSTLWYDSTVGPSSEVSSFTASSPEPPTLNSTIATTTTNINLNWTHIDNNNMDGYKIEEQTDPSYFAKWAAGNGGAFPAGIGVDYYGNVWAGDSGPDDVWKTTNTGSAVCTIDVTPGSVHDLDVNPTTGYTYVTDAADEVVRIYDDSCVFVDSWGSPGTGIGEFNNVSGIGIDRLTGNVFTAEQSTDRMQKFDSDGNYLDDWTISGASGSDVGIAVDSQGNVWYIDVQGNDLLKKYSSNGTLIDQYACSGTSEGCFTAAADLTIDDQDNVWVVDAAQDKIVKYSNNGTYLYTYDQGDGVTCNDGDINNPVNISIDQFDTLFVLSNGCNRIQVFEMWDVVVADTGNNSTSYSDTVGISELHTYRVSAINTIGTSSPSNASSAYTLPAPTNFLATVAASTQINLSWDNPGVPGITGYRIDRESPIGGGWLTLINPGNVTSYNDNGLSLLTEYNYRISAIDDIGVGITSTESNATTFVSQPTNLTTTSISQTQINLSWAAPFGPIVGYKIERESPIGSGFVTIVANTTNPFVAYNNTGLTSATQYNYRVSSIDELENISGPSDEAYNWTRPNAPISPSAAPKSFVADQINLEWTAPSGTITGYLIERESPIGSGWAVIEANCTCVGNYYNDTGLTENTTYNYRIASITNPIGPFSPPFNATTGERPDAPLNIVASIPGAPLDILVSWDAPLDIGSNTVITGYDIIRSVNATAYASLVNDTAGLTYNDLAVVPGTNYTYAVGAKGDVINGNFSAPSNTITTAGVSSVPFGLSALPKVTGDSVQLDWLAPTDDGGDPINGYKIERQDDGGGWGTIVANTTNTDLTYDDSGLSLNTLYEYRVSAINGIGVGGFSTSNSTEFLVGNLNITAQVFGGQLHVSSSLTNMTWGIPDGTTSLLKLYLDDVGSTTFFPVVNVPKNTGFNFTDLIAYPDSGNYNVHVNLTIANGAPGTLQIKSNTIFIALAGDNFGDFSFYENRLNDFTTSNMTFIGETSGYSLVVSYQEQNGDTVYYSWQNVVANATKQIPVASSSTYYITTFANPTFDFTGDNGNVGTADVPSGYPGTHTGVSLGDPTVFNIGIDALAGESGIFGLPLVFIFIIALSSIFTGRNSPMGIIFIAAAIGVMTYMGLISFDFDVANQSNIATWAIIIVAVIIGVMVGKRWD